MINTVLHANESLVAKYFEYFAMAHLGYWVLAAFWELPPESQKNQVTQTGPKAKTGKKSRSAQKRFCPIAVNAYLRIT